MNTQKPKKTASVKPATPAPAHGFDIEAVHPRNVGRDCARFALVARTLNEVLDALGDYAETDDLHFSPKGILEQHYRKAALATYPG